MNLEFPREQSDISNINKRLNRTENLYSTRSTLNEEVFFQLCFQNLLIAMNIPIARSLKKGL
jgi:hypothetical protein